MSFSQFQCKERICEIAHRQGFAKCGFAEAGSISAECAAQRQQWIAQGCNATMNFMLRHIPLSQNTANVLPSAKTVIVLAMSYFSHDSLPGFARYALGDDYHTVLRQRAEPIAKFLESQGFETRITVDTAPMAERFWARQAGLGAIGRNSNLIIPGMGSFFFIATILTSAQLQPDAPFEEDLCGECTKCVEACPGEAICVDRTVDARRCLSYLTIEHRGDFPEGTDLRGRIYGCDTCQNVCPHNADAVATSVGEFRLRESLHGLSAEKILNMTHEQYSVLFRNSAVKRAKLQGLQRNAAAVLHGKKE